MKSHLVLLALVGLACASVSPAWKDNTEYVYLVNGRTLTSLHELSDQYSGIVMRAQMHIIPLSDGKLQARIPIAEYAQIHSQFPEDWNTFVPEAQLTFKQLDLSSKPFQIILKDGLIKSLIVEQDMANWQANVIKSIVSQFQLDLKGKNRIYSPITNMPREDRFDGVFKTMEETVTGETETSYDIHRLPQYLIQSEPWLVPQPELLGNGQIVEIIKNKNFSNSDETPAYHYGFAEVTEGHPTHNHIGNFYTRDSNSRVIVTGTLSKYTIQSSRTINKIIVNPTLNSKEQGSVVSIVNVTLHKVKSQSEQPQGLLNPIEIGDLVYTFDNAFASSNKVHQKQEGKLYPESSEERSSSEDSWQRFRRGAIKKLQQDENDSSSSSSSFEEKVQYQSRPSLNQPPEFPLLPYYMGYYGQSIKSNIELDLKQNIKRLSKEISEDVQDPKKILTHSTLSKYSMMCSLIRLLTEEDIKSIAEDIFTNSKQGYERYAWVAFRDAVAEAGTGPALLNIQQWILTKKIQEQEASEVIAAMAKAVRVPTKEYMRKFFELIKKPEVTKQETLNETALLVFTKLVNTVYVNKNQSNNEYPVHSFRNFYTKEGKDFVNTTVIPYLAQQLHKYVSQADSRKIHVYIRALGNVGHREILKEFEPYLEGTKQVSQFQRMLMVLSMDELVRSDPEVAASVFYKIYQNTAEIPEVRVVAVYQLIRTNPPVEMIQRMAENTNTDPQVQVNAAVKSVIESASKLRSVESQKLRQAAESAKALLTKKQYGKQQSLNFLQEFIIENMDLDLHHNYLQVGSADYDLPKGFKYGVRTNTNGMRTNVFQVQTMLSSVRELVTVLYRQTQNYHKSAQLFNKQSAPVAGSSWSSPKIAELLNLETNEREQLEGFIYAQMEHYQQLWSFDNESIARLPEAIREQQEILKNGKQLSYIKLKHLTEMVLALPTEMGLPFLYTYDKPMFVQFEGKINAAAEPEISRNNKFHTPDQITAKVDGFVTVSFKDQTHLKVVTPFDHQIYIAGFDKNVQVHVPIKVSAKVNVKTQQAEIEFTVEESHKDASLAHYSSWPYTSKHDIMSLSPIALSPTTYLIKPQGHRSFDFVIGQQETGMSFRVWGHQPQQSKNLFELIKILQTADLSTLWELLWNEASMHQTEANIALIPDQTTTSKVRVLLGHKGKYQKQSEIQSEASCTLEQLSSKLDQEPEARQQDMLKCVGSGIQSSRLHAFDGSVEFQGAQTYKHIFSLAFAKSNVAPESRLVAFYKIMSRQPKEFAVKVKSYIPNTNAMDVTYALKTKPIAKYDVVFHQRHWEQGFSKIQGTVNFTRSEERKTYIERQPLYEVCKKQMQEGNRHLPACQNLTIESNYFDNIKVELQYDNLKKEMTDFFGNFLKTIRVFFYSLTETRSVELEEANKLTLRVQFQPKNLRQVNITVTAKNEETKLFNLSLSEFAKTAFVSHPVYHLKSRVFGKLLQQDNIRPTCVIDNRAAQTYSNFTYPLSLGQEWSLMMLYVPQQARLLGQGRQTPAEQLRTLKYNFAVLVRQLDTQKKEVKITFNHPETESKSLEVILKPKQAGSALSLVAVLVDGNEVKFDDKQAASLFDGYVEIYALPSGEVKMEIQNWFYIISDGSRVKLTATSDNLRDSIVGLCGRFSEDKFEDLWVPSNCIVRSADKFAKSFVLEGRQQQHPRKYPECIAKVLPLYADVISDYDVQRKGGERSSGTNMRTRYVEGDGNICFTLYPVPVCENVSQDSIIKEVPVHCITKTKTAYYFKNQIDQGGNPDFSQKDATKTIQMEIPRHC